MKRKSTYQKIRNSWGDISPVTKVIPNKKKHPSEKYKDWRAVR